MALLQFLRIGNCIMAAQVIGTAFAILGIGSQNGPKVIHSGTHHTGVVKLGIGAVVSKWSTGDGERCTFRITDGIEE